MPERIITLTTDFGLRDPYVAEMKAVILSIYPDVVIVDVTHEIEKFNVRMAAFILASAVPFFPNGAIHVAIVDPGVGTRRRPLIIQTQRSLFVGPDNGLMMLAAKHQGLKSIHEVANPKFMLLEVSSTFHGRDIFAPVAAHLANGVRPDEFGLEIHDAVTPEFMKVRRNGDRLIGNVLYVDSFGNIITNITKKELRQLEPNSLIKLDLSDQKLELKLCKAYDEVKLQEPLALIGSSNLLEIAIN